MIVAVVGLGLIGGSIALGLAESGVSERVIGFDNRTDACDYFRERGTFDVADQDFFRAGDADVWVLAVPPALIPILLEEIRPHVKADAAITDVASAKGFLENHLDEDLRQRFIGGHPIAGLAVSHHSIARGSMFTDASWVLCGYGDYTREAAWKVETVVYALDAKPTWMSPEDHDRHVALFSHLPHAIAALLVQLGSRMEEPELGGGSWRDLTRIAGNYPELWKQIFCSNSESIRGQIAVLIEGLQDLDQVLASGDADALYDFFKAAERKKLESQV